MTRETPPIRLLSDLDSLDDPHAAASSPSRGAHSTARIGMRNPAMSCRDGRRALDSHDRALLTDFGIARLPDDTGHVTGAPNAVRATPRPSS
ncbi:hypothetical protein ACQP2U_34795 [Nocardia sp. CA-084685]|uniref:hypothetical protein n=1 Tax=Nocardia sp. CA-084685 TaxID=3239970 RepID=UPI003D9A0B61